MQLRIYRKGRCYHANRFEFSRQNFTLSHFCLKKITLRLFFYSFCHHQNEDLSVICCIGLRNNSNTNSNECKWRILVFISDKLETGIGKLETGIGKSSWPVQRFEMEQSTQIDQTTTTTESTIANDQSSK